LKQRNKSSFQACPLYKITKTPKICLIILLTGSQSLFCKWDYKFFNQRWLWTTTRNRVDTVSISDLKKFYTGLPKEVLLLWPKPLTTHMTLCWPNSSWWKQDITEGSHYKVFFNKCHHTVNSTVSTKCADNGANKYIHNVWSC
jgi:hypothetical protein